MADETFEIGIQVSGEDKAARAFENLKLRQMETAAEAAKLAAELRKLQQSGTATAEQIEAASRALIRAKAQAAEYGAQATRVQRAMQAQAQATRQVTQAQTAQATATQRVTQVSQAQGTQVVGLGQRWGQLASAMGSVSPVLGSLSPELGRFSGIITGVGSATTAMTGAMGPLGVALGAITTVIGVASIAWNAYEESTREAAQETVDATLSIEQAAAARAQQAVTESRARLMRLRDGGSNEDFVRESENLRALEAQHESIMRPIRERQRLTEQLAQEERDRNTRQDQTNASAEENARILAEINATMADIEATESRRAANAAAANARAREFRSTINELAGQSEASFAERQRAEDATWARATDQIRDLYRFWDEQDQASIEAQLDRAESLANKRAEIAEQEKVATREKAEAVLAHQREIGAITSGMWDSIGGTVTDAAGQMFKFLISGAEGGTDAFLALLDSFLESTSIEYTIKALGEVANAVAAAARQDYAAAAQHGVAAALAAGVAAATGLASAAISVPAAGGGGGGGAPAPVGASAPAGGGTTNITVQFYAPNVLYTEAERGEMAARAVREAERARPGSARI